MEPLPGWESSPWSQAPTANTFRLGLCVFLLNFLSCVAVEPLCKEEEYSVGDQCCPMCSPGYHVKHACSNWTGIVCAPCPPQTYTAHANGLSECLSCGVCDPDMGLVTWRECSSREDTVCRCIPGYFCETQEGDHCSTCLPHTNCSLGQRVLERGNHIQDTVCADCPTGTFSLGGAQEECLPWTKCDAWYQKAEHGTSSTDATCSFSGLFYFICFSPLGFILVLVVVVIVVYIRRKTSRTRPVARELEPLQRQEQHNTVKLPVAEVGSAAIEETAFNRVNSG
ncbi:tumor necrosis factor receptor superfamily member 14 isoform X1 [Arvicola amphibius]|uniref:tumor necrosis factor receptor superfamily member 14 isoform X1 n=1 Tax=Arvicola amphibius TaxID=1047088 RepID=UPI0018E31BC1|nr:tumor necrosis factor receptor superfamily member 14 isoform X1 [Arvicola amphibius]